MSGIIEIKTLEFDVSNKCGNTCQGCYHNKVITEKSTTPEKFQDSLEKVFDINQYNSLDSFALYGGNILENTNFLQYLSALDRYHDRIGEYLFSTTFGAYNAIARSHQDYLLGSFFKDKKFIFQYFFNPDFTSEYIASCKDLLSYQYDTHIFFSVQLVEVSTEYIKHLIQQLRRFFLTITSGNVQSLEKIENAIFTALREKNRTENIKMNIGTYTFYIMILHPVRKEKGIITSVCGNSCSFFSSSKIENDIYSSTMLSIEYDGAINFHNPNCIASLQRICNIDDTPEEISKSLKIFFEFLRGNVSRNPQLIDACNACLKNNTGK